MAPPLINLRDIHLTFGGTPLLEGAEFSVSSGERLCLVGRNGSGKSTLLNAVERSIYNHIPGDGREGIVTAIDTMKIRAEDGRCVHSLNLSNYINHLPMQKDTSNFRTQDASGSTSQAAWLQESI